MKEQYLRVETKPVRTVLEQYLGVGTIRQLFSALVLYVVHARPYKIL